MAACENSLLHVVLRPDAFFFLLPEQFARGQKSESRHELSRGRVWMKPRRNNSLP
jgi:hypothetical protein